MEQVTSGFLKDTFALLRLLKKILLIVGAHEVIIRVNPIAAARLGILRFNHPDLGQLHIHAIVYLDADEIVLLAGDLQCVVKIRIQKIAKQKDDSLLPRRVIKESNRLTQVGAAMFRLDRQQPPDNKEHMVPSLFWRNIPFDPVTEEDDAYFIVVVDRGESKHRAYFGDEVLFAGMDGTKQRAGTDIHEQ